MKLKYPVLYSGVLAILWWLLPSFPENVALFKAFNVIALFVGLLLSYPFLRLNTTPSRTDAVTYVVLIGACPLVFSLTRLPLSDTLFFALTVGAIALQRVRGPAGTIALATVAARTSRQVKYQPAGSW